jgi:2-amino-4-hydroxy-6-hydroxymethyldihydropteridine diphosphokinase
MKKCLGNGLVLHFTKNFPRRFRRSNKKFQVTLGVGANVGDSIRRFEKLLIVLHRSKIVDLRMSSPILKNPPFGYLDQDDFYNCTLVVQTNLYPQAFLRYVLRLEKKFKRRRSFKNAPRTLDLDIIFFSNFVINTKDLRVPHPKWSERQSVVIPLRYMYGIKNV